ncbi:MAG TPA: ribosome maturation factor RimM [Candidatus Aminicenantes bacterium]|nr:ribosome maturation factor RimM [Candidatus Aminicenantes bacterium]
MVTLGKFLKPVGLRGEVEILPLSFYLDRYLELRTVYVEGEPKVVESAQIRGRRVVLKLEGIDDPRQVLFSLQGREFQIPDEERWELQEDQFYIDDLVGCEVWDSREGKIGVVASILPAGNDLLSVRREGGKEVLIPFVKEFCVHVDREKRRIDTVLPSDLLDLS